MKKNTKTHKSVVKKGEYMNQGIVGAIRDASMSEKIAIGAAGVAVTAGVVAAASALSNRKTRNKLVKVAQNAGKTIEKVSDRIDMELPQKGYQAFQHRIGKPAKGSKPTSKRGSKKS